MRTGGNDPHPRQARLRHGTPRGANEILSVLGRVASGNYPMSYLCDPE